MEGFRSFIGRFAGAGQTGKSASDIVMSRHNDNPYDTENIDHHVVHGSDEHKIAALDHPDAEPHHFEAAAEHGSWRVQKHIASHPNAPEHVLDKLSTHEDGNIRKFVASNPSTSPNTLHNMGTKYNLPHSITIGVVNNPNTSERTLRHIRDNHKDPDISHMAAGRLADLGA